VPVVEAGRIPGRPAPHLTTPDHVDRRRAVNPTRQSMLERA
jgi:hypothetical protein